MSEKTTPICEYGQNAYDFSLSCTNEKIWTLDKLKGERGLLIFFICNHCPFVKAILPKLVRSYQYSYRSWYKFCWHYV